jgi:hypothetical protein
MGYSSFLLHFNACCGRRIHPPVTFAAFRIYPEFPPALAYHKELQDARP